MHRFVESASIREKIKWEGLSTSSLPGAFEQGATWWLLFSVAYENWLMGWAQSLSEAALVFAFTSPHSQLMIIAVSYVSLSNTNELRIKPVDWIYARSLQDSRRLGFKL